MGEGYLDALYSLGSKLNKLLAKKPDEEQQGIVSEKMPELELEMSNEDIIDATNKWLALWDNSDVKAKFEKVGNECEDYWKGIQHQRPELDKSRPMVDNIIFESLETYLPRATSKNPGPVIALGSQVEKTPENLEYPRIVQADLEEIADVTKLRLKLGRVTRHWALRLLGVAQMGWDLEKNIPSLEVIYPKRIILDPEAVTDEDGYHGEFVGKHRKMEAGKLLRLLENAGGEPEGIAYINGLVGDNLATQLGFIEWWTDEYVCYTMKNHVLLKKRNPHWDYDVEAQMAQDENGEMVESQSGQPGVNHLPAPKKPFIFLTVFNTGKQPVDETSLIAQNLANQDLINKKNTQIDKNVDSMNNGMAVSLERSGLTAETAKNVSAALAKGGTIAIPTGNVNEAIARMSASNLPADVFNDRNDLRSRVKDIFGVSGINASGLLQEKTVRGKTAIQNTDNDRIGGGVSQYIEQFADDVFNWMVQLLYVYDDRYRAMDRPPILVSVKEGSMLPKDSRSIADQAIELAAAGKMSLLDLYKRLEFPNPEEIAANVWLEANAPEVLYAGDQRVAQVIAERANAQPEQKPPSESIGYKDLTPDAKAQMLAKVGIQADPEAIAVHEEHLANKEAEQRKMEAEMALGNDMTRAAHAESIKPKPEPKGGGKP